MHNSRSNGHRSTAIWCLTLFIATMTCPPSLFGRQVEHGSHFAQLNVDYYRSPAAEPNPTPPLQPHARWLGKHDTPPTTGTFAEHADHKANLSAELSPNTERNDADEQWRADLRRRLILEWEGHRIAILLVAAAVLGLALMSKYRMALIACLAILLFVAPIGVILVAFVPVNILIAVAAVVAVITPVIIFVLRKRGD